MQHFRFFSLLLTLFASSVLSAQKLGNLSGSVRDQLTQEPLIGVTIRLEGADLGTTTDIDGNFKLENIPPRSYNVTATYLGYLDQTRFNVVITTGNTNQLNFQLEPNSLDIGEVVITTNKSVRIASAETPLSIQNLSIEEIKSNPGGNFDISKVVQALPGVSAGAGGGGGGRNDLIIRGGGPSENVFYLDGVEIPVINHFATQGAAGGPTGLLNVSFIEDVTLSTSAFNARYDNPLSAVLQFTQRDGNPDRLQGNFRVSGSETALTTEGPLSKSGKTTFLASARRSYLQFLFQALGLPIRPDYWDFQYKITHKIDSKTTISSVGVGAIDEFYFEAPKEATPENLYILGSVPSINQWNYTQGFTLKRLIENGYWNLTFSRNMFDNQLDQFTDNFDAKQTDESKRKLKLESREIENKLRFDYNRFAGAWKFSFGAGAQLVKYENNTFNRVLPEVQDSLGNLLQPGVTVNFNTAIQFLKFGAFGQVSRTLLNNRLAVSAGVRTDGNTFTDTGAEVWRTLSPRASLSYALSKQWKANASAGRYFKLAPYTVLGFQRDNEFVNKSVDYLQSTHYVTGLEYLPTPSMRITLEGFYKQYRNYPVSELTGISLANLGGDFQILGNEPVSSDGKGEAYGLELFFQQKLRNNFFFTGSYTLFWSNFSGRSGDLIPSAWDNRHLVSAILGYKFRKNWELGVKYRFQGGVPYTPFDLAASRLNYAVTGTGTLDVANLNSLRLAPFNQLDIRIDKKWNFRRTTLDLFFDIQNALAAKNEAVPNYTFARNADNSGWLTTDGKPLATDGSNAQPIILPNFNSTVLPTLGIIVEF
jgi:outer membrane cobalamin receptor